MEQSDIFSEPSEMDFHGLGSDLLQRQGDVACVAAGSNEMISASQSHDSHLRYHFPYSLTVSAGAVGSHDQSAFTQSLQQVNPLPMVFVDQDIDFNRPRTQSTSPQQHDVPNQSYFLDVPKNYQTIASTTSNAPSTIPTLELPSAYNSLTHTGSLTNRSRNCSTEIADCTQAPVAANVEVSANDDIGGHRLEQSFDHGIPNHIQPEMISIHLGPESHSQIPIDPSVSLEMSQDLPTAHTAISSCDHTTTAPQIRPPPPLAKSSSTLTTTESTCSPESLERLSRIKHRECEQDKLKRHEITILPVSSNDSLSLPRQKWSRRCLIFLFVQGVLLIALQSAQIAMHVSDVNYYSESWYIKTGLEAPIITFMVIVIVAIMFQIYLFVAGIKNQNILETRTGVIFSLLILGCAVTQVIEQKRSSALAEEFNVGSQQRANLASANSMVFSFQFTVIAISSISVLTLAFLSRKLNSEFAWNLYKRIGADTHTRSIYRSYHLYMVLLKLVVFFFYSYLILFLALVAYHQSIERPIFATVFFIVTPPLLYLGYIGIRRERRIAVIAYIVFCVVTFSWLLYRVILTLRAVTGIAVFVDTRKFSPSIRQTTAASLVAEDYSSDTSSNINDIDASEPVPRPEPSLSDPFVAVGWGMVFLATVNLCLFLSSIVIAIASMKNFGRGLVGLYEREKRERWREAGTASLWSLFRKQAFKLRRISNADKKNEYGIPESTDRRSNIDHQVARQHSQVTLNKEMEGVDNIVKLGVPELDIASQFVNSSNTRPVLRAGLSPP